MNKKTKLVTALLSVALVGASSWGAARKRSSAADASKEAVGQAVLWRYPSDIASRDLFYGPGGKDHAPPTRFTFLREDLDGTNPKFTVRDENGVKWKVKLGQEARPETAASRLVWAVGYYTNEDYFVRELHVQGMPAHLHRGQNLVSPDGTVRNVRLKRYLDGEKKIGGWKWRRNRFSGTRELNGLRVMMALINNWDLKDINNSLYQEQPSAASPTPATAATTERPERRYEVTDLGASFGSNGRSGRTTSKGNLNSYRRSKFIRKETREYADFGTPARPALIYAVNPREFFGRLRLRWIRSGVPVGDAAWMGNLLAQLSPEQIRDAFRAAGYPPAEVDGFTDVVLARITALQALGDTRRASLSRPERPREQ